MIEKPPTEDAGSGDSQMPATREAAAANGEGGSPPAKSEPDGEPAEGTVPDDSVRFIAGRVLGEAHTQLSCGQVIASRFQVDRLAGAGGMGAVYRAKDLRTDRPVALKLLVADIAQGDERFAREAEVLEEMQHPAIVRYVAHGTTEEGKPYLAMEWLDGEDLSSRLARGHLSVADSVVFATQVAEALVVAHARGVVHRDINPRNLFLLDKRVDAVKVLDFGIAWQDGNVQRLTLTGGLVGTPGYMAPEQASATREIDGRADIYALGCVLFECLTGCRAFVGNNLMEVLAKVLLDQAVSARDVNEQVPPALDQLVARMLHKDPEHRPPTAEKVLEMLEMLDALDSTTPQPVGEREELTDSEQRVLSVVIARNIELPRRSQGKIPADKKIPVAVGFSTQAREDVADAVAPYGARVEWLVDGGVVASLEGHGNATDRAAQAARCALAMREILVGAPMALATGLGKLSGQNATGPVIARAASSVTSADDPSDAEEQARAIVIDEVTAGLLGGRFDVRGGTQVLTLHGLRTSVQPTRTLLGKAAPCVGRNRELLTLEATCEECCQESVARVVLVSAPPGLGKTRLRGEFISRLEYTDDVPQVWVASGDSMSAGAPFVLMARMLRQAAGIAENESPTVQQQKLRSRVSRHVPASDSQRVAEFLGELIGTQFPDSSQLLAARREPMLRGDQMRRAVEDLIAAECEHQPLLLVLDDLQWGDWPTIKLIDSLLRNLNESRLMVLALARPEVHDLFPKVWQGRDLSELRLGPLSRKACTRLCREVLGLEASERAIERIVERAGGNAFWLEELLRAEDAGRGKESTGTMLVLAQSRIEQLDPQSRMVLRAGSVLGRKFWRGAVMALMGTRISGADLDKTLRRLDELEVVGNAGPGRFAGETEYVFRNSLLREAAYASLEAEDRVLGHRLAGEWLQKKGELDSLALANHFKAGQAPELAVPHYRVAAREALEGNDFSGAIQRAQLGIDCSATGDELAALLVTQGESGKWLGDNEGARRVSSEAISVAEIGGEPWCGAIAECAVACGKLGDQPQLEDLAKQILDAPEPGQYVAAFTTALSRIASQLALAGSRDLAKQVLERAALAAEVPEAASAMGWLYEAWAGYAGVTGDVAARLSLAEKAAQAFDANGDHRNACLQRVSIGFACNELGAFDRAQSALDEALAVAKRLSMSNSIPVALAQLGRARGQLGQTEAGLSLLDEAIVGLDRQHNKRLGGAARIYRAMLLVSTGEVETAFAAASDAVDKLRGIPSLLACAKGVLAHVEMVDGQREAALKSAKVAYDELEELGQAVFGESLIRLVYALTLHESGSRELALKVIRVARLRVEERSSGITDPEVQSAFLALYENTATLEVSHQWQL